MDNTLNTQRKKGFFQKIAELSFMIYMITLYIFVDRLDTIIISQLAFILFAGLTVLVILQKQRIHFGKSVMIVYLAFAWMFATYFWAQNQMVAWTKIKTMWQLFLLFFLTYNLFCEEENAHEYLVKCLYIAGIALVGYSIHTYGLGKVLDMMTGKTAIRLGNDINQENTFGIMNATTVVTGFYYLFYKSKFKVLHLAVIAGSFLFVMASGSRTALLMMCVGVLYLVYKRYGIRQLYKLIAIVVVLVLAFMFLIQLPVFEFIKTRMEQAMEIVYGTGKGDSSANIRYNMIKDGWEIFKGRMLTGYGAENYAIVSRYKTYSHNNFVEILVDFGLIGFVLYYYIYLTAFKNLRKFVFNEGKVLLSIFLVRFVMEMFTIFYFDKLQWIMFAFFLMKPVKSVEGEMKSETDIEKIEKGCNQPKSNSAGSFK